MRRSVSARSVAAGFLVLATGARGQTASIAARVTDAASNLALDQARLIVVGTTLGGVSDAHGHVLIRGLAPGDYQLRVLRQGYADQKRAVSIVQGVQVSAEFSLRAVAVSSASLVTTLTGEIRREEVASAVAAVDAATAVALSPIMTVDDLLTARFAGATVTPGTQTGAGSRVRIRGASSLHLSNEPIYMIDGVRMTSSIGSSNLFTGGSQPSRVGDLNPEEIESIEVVKGPSGSALYGSGAANGVIVITTKRGRAGAVRWTAYGEAGLLKDRNPYPTAYTIFGKRAGETTTAPLNFCNLARVSRGECGLDSVASLNLFEEPDLTPLGTGHRSQYGLQLTGGSELIRYFVSGEREEEGSPLQLPEFERRRFESTNTAIHDWTERPNTLGRTSARANLYASLTPQLDFTVTSGFIKLAQRFSLESNATAGLGSQVFGGPGCRVCSPERVVSVAGTPLQGYRAWTPGYTWQEHSGQKVNRYIAVASAIWRPTSWLQNRLTSGRDVTDRRDNSFLFDGEGPPLTAAYPQGFSRKTDANIRTLTSDVVSTAIWNLTGWLNVKTSAGLQHVRHEFEQHQALGSGLPANGPVPNPVSTGDLTTRWSTLGLFIEQAAALNDRLFLTAAIRSDQSTIFGTELSRVLYPKAALSWIISDESFFPSLGILDQLRLVAAVGSSGQQLGPNEGLLAFQGVSDQPLGGGTAGATREPERTTEIEGGVEGRFFGGRGSLGITYYHKRTQDVLISTVVPPSAGASGSVQPNAAVVQNAGWELLVAGQLLDRRALAIDLSLSASTNANRVASLGGAPPVIGVTTWIVEGYPLFGYWARRITGWEDKNKDGSLTYNADAAINEVFVADSATFRGYTQPRHLANLTTALSLFDRRVRIQSLFEYRGGHKWFNSTDRIRCTSRQNCAGVMHPGSSFEDQAMAVAARDHPARSLDGFFQKGDYVRLRELALQYVLPGLVRGRLFRARSAHLTLAARNLKRWTAYRGVDPAADFGASVSSDVPAELQTLGLPTHYILRLNIMF